jgi:alpha-tubulin suppressor-like RCC1 family protein
MQEGKIIRALVGALVLAAGGSCSVPGSVGENGDVDRGNTTPAANPDEVAVVRLSFTTVPDPVKCVSVSAVSGGQTKTKNVDVTPGSKPAGGNPDGSFDLGRFAPGAVTFSAKGFEVACASVTSSVVASWFSKAQTINIVPGPDIMLTLNLQRFRSPDVTVNFELTPVRLSGTGIATVAVLDDGTAKLWGFDASDTLVVSNRILVPTTIAGLASVVQVAGGYRHNCAALKDGTVRCWGQGLLGALGDGDGSSHFRAAPGNVVAGLTGVVEIAAHRDLSQAGAAHTCAVLATRELKCWGSNENGAIGQPSTITSSTTPVTVNVYPFVGIGIDHVCAGAGFGCALDDKGYVSCWGRNDVGQLGRGHADPVPAGDIDRIAGAGAVTSLACGGNGACVVRGDGSLACWGQIFGEAVVTPTKLEPSGVQQVVVGTVSGASNFACIRKTNQQVVCWGRNLEGELGDGTGVNRETRDVVTIASGATDLAAGTFHACAIVEGRTLCWGDGAFIGDGTPQGRPVPTSVKW